MDYNTSLDETLAIFNQNADSWIITQNQQKNNNLATKDKTHYLDIPSGPEMIPKLLDKLSEAQKAILMVEGGAHLINQFIQQGYWNEARVLEAVKTIENGIPAPQIPKSFDHKFQIGSDNLYVYYKPISQILAQLLICLIKRTIING